MKIGIDLHGTIDSNPRMFSALMKDLMSRGHQLFIISGSDTDKIISELYSLEIASESYTEIYSCTEFLRKEIKVLGWYNEKGNWFCNDYLWWASKSLICKKYKIDLLIDNQTEYQEYFGINHPTKFLLFDNAKKLCQHFNFSF